MTLCKILSLALHSRVVVFLCYQALPGATHSPCCCVMSWHVLAPRKRRSDFTQFPCTPELALQESGVPAGGRTCGAGERIFLLVRMWLTGKSWNQDLNDLYGRLGFKKHSFPLFISPCLRLGLQSQRAFQLRLTEHLPACCPDSLSPEVPAAWPLYGFAPKGARSRQVEEFSFRTLAHFCWAREVFFPIACPLSGFLRLPVVSARCSFVSPKISTSSPGGSVEPVEEEVFKIEGMSTMKFLDTFSKQLSKFTGKKTSGATKPKDIFSLLWASLSHEFLLELWRRLWGVLLIVLKVLLTQLSLTPV